MVRADGRLTPAAQVECARQEVGGFSPVVIGSLPSFKTVGAGGVLSRSAERAGRRERRHGRARPRLCRRSSGCLERWDPLLVSISVHTTPARLCVPARPFESELVDCALRHEELSARRWHRIRPRVSTVSSSQANLSGVLSNFLVAIRRACSIVEPDNVGRNRRINSDRAVP